MKRLLGLLPALWLSPAYAQAPSAQLSAQPTASASAEPLASCTELIPEGASPPHLDSRVEPQYALSGHVVYLVVTVSHGAGETLLPEGFELTGGGDAVSVLKEARWFIPDPLGGTATVIEAPSEEERSKATVVTSKARIPFIPLPKEAGRHDLILPPIPIAVARANGQVMTLCTKPHPVIVDDPIANEVDPDVRPNPPPRPQRERWEAAVRAATIAGIALPIAIALAALAIWWLRRPKPAPVVPKIPPWITAMKDLSELRQSGLLDEERVDEYFDRVDHITRFYLGERYGFDGLESTSEEIRGAIKRIYPPVTEPERIQRFLEEADFIKFAEVTPSRDDCLETIDRAEAIVRATMPRAPQADPRRPRRAA